MHLNVFVRFEGVIAPDFANSFFTLHDGSICDVQTPTEQNTLSMAALNTFLDEQRIDTSCSSLIDLCRRHHVPVTVVSHDFDYSINRILHAHGIFDVNVVANHLKLDGDRLTSESPHRNPDCSCGSCCPRNSILNNTPDQTAIAFVGAGADDGCPASYADIVFARGELQTCCQQKNISYREFRTLNDVTVALNQILLKRRIPKRREAEHLRRAAFSAE